MRTAILLRAVNLGAHNRLSMPAVKKLLEDNGYTGVATYLQSGNVVVDGDVKPAAIERLLGVDVMVRTHAQLKRIIDTNPFPEHIDEPAKLAVGFCDRATSAAIERDAYAPDEIVIKGENIFMWYPNGLGRSKIGPALGKKLGVKMTVRNWNTVTKLLALTESPAGKSPSSAKTQSGKTQSGKTQSGKTPPGKTQSAGKRSGKTGPKA